MRLCTTGRPPYRGRSAHEVRLQAIRGELGEALQALAACGAERGLIDLARRCLAPEQEDRPADGRVVAAEVARIRQAAEERARRAELERAEAQVRAAEQGKRRRLLLRAAVLTAAILLLGLIGTTAGYLQAERAAQQERLARQEAQLRRRQAEEARQRAEQAAEREEQARHTAERRLQQLARSNELLTSVFEDLDIKAVRERSQPLEAVLAQRLVAAGQALQEEALGDPELMAEMQNRLAISLMNLGFAPEAIGLFQAAYQTCKAKLGADHPNTLGSMNNLANAYRAAGRLYQALPLYEAAVRGVERRQFQHPHAKMIVRSAVGAFLEARQYHWAHRWRPALVAVAVGPRSLGYVQELASVGQELLQQGHYPEAEELLRQCLNIRVSAHPQAWTTSQTRSLLGAALLGRARTTADPKKKAELLAVAEALGRRLAGDKRRARRDSREHPELAAPGRFRPADYPIHGTRKTGRGGPLAGRASAPGNIGFHGPTGPGQPARAALSASRPCCPARRPTAAAGQPHQSRASDQG